MTNGDMARRLNLISSVRTPVQGVRNELVHVGIDTVTVRSERTGRDRDIPYDQIRNAANETQNGVVVRTLAQVLGLYSP